MFACYRSKFWPVVYAFSFPFFYLFFIYSLLPLPPPPARRYLGYVPELVALFSYLLIVSRLSEPSSREESLGKRVKRVGGLLAFRCGA